MPLKNFIAAILLLHFGSSAGFCERICTVPKAENCVAITFDDGPSSETTREIIGILKRFGARATFFVTGESANRFPEVLREMVESGNEVGNHAYTHPDLLFTIEALVCSELERTQAAITKITGRRPTVFRPPFSKVDEYIECITEEMDLRVVLWSVSPADWLDPSPETIAERVLSVIKPGDIVVMHDGRFPKTAMSDGHLNTATALPLILEGLKKKGLASVTVSELLNK